MHMKNLSISANQVSMDINKHNVSQLETHLEVYIM